MNRQVIMLIAMVVSLGVFFSDTILQLFSKGSVALPSLSKPSAPKGIAVSYTHLTLPTKRIV